MEIDVDALQVLPESEPTELLPYSETCAATCLGTCSKTG